MPPSTTRLDAPPPEAAIDPEIYAALGEIMQDEMASLVDDFLFSTDELLAQIAAAELSRDLPAMKLHAHSIKSSAAAVGALGLSELARGLEAQADIGRFEELADSSATLRREFVRASSELERLAGAQPGS
jgi:HPt (histidine-containing phosphotransfer) domain-containing protein